ncbi:MAG: recombination mediator RecR [Candidatus Magasanikbacteria bacterium]
MTSYSKSITNLINTFKKLPAVGERTAERYVFSLLKNGRGNVAELQSALSELLKNTKSCEVCWNFVDISPCSICADTKRDHNMVCVVADPQDIISIEKTGAFRGVYHVLRGLIDMDDEGENKNIKIKDLLKRIKTDKNITEIILALNPDLPGETTAMYIEQEIKNLKLETKIKISRLARGLPMGSDLQYADEITLGSALKNRK